ncbi:MAG: hypothetical protein ACI81R_002746 [Bradymonadia bacterium]|jgi:hypothetical protein
MIRRALRILVCGAALAACADSPCETGDNCSCSFDSDCPDPLVEFCDRRVFACEPRDEPLQPDVVSPDAGQDGASDVVPDTAEPELCENGVDDDGDGLIDCDDPVCVLACDPPDLSVAFVESAGLPQVAVVPIVGGASRTVAGEGPTQLATDPAFSTDGRLAVVFADATFDGLRIITVDGTLLGSVANGDGVTLLRQPSWTAAGTILAAGSANGDRVILELSLDGSAATERYRETNTDRYVGAPTQLSDGSVIVVTGETAGGFGGGTGDLAILREGSLLLVTDGLRLSGRFVPDDRGGLYAFSAAAGRTVYIQPREGVPLTLAEVELVAGDGDSGCAPINVDALVCSRSFEQPSGVRVADLVIVDRAGTVLRRLTDTPTVSEGAAVVSPPLAGRTPAP